MLTDINYERPDGWKRFVTGANQLPNLSIHIFDQLEDGTQILAAAGSIFRFNNSPKGKGGWPIRGERGSALLGDASESFAVN